MGPLTIHLRLSGWRGRLRLRRAKFGPKLRALGILTRSIVCAWHTTNRRMVVRSIRSAVRAVVIAATAAMATGSAGAQSRPSCEARSSAAASHAADSSSTRASHTLQLAASESRSISVTMLGDTLCMIRSIPGSDGKQSVDTLVAQFDGDKVFVVSASAKAPASDLLARILRDLRDVYRDEVDLLRMGVPVASPPSGGDP